MLAAQGKFQEAKGAYEAALAKLDGAAFDHETGRREMIGKTILYQIATSHTQCMQRSRKAPPIHTTPFGIKDRTRRHEDARQIAGRCRGKATERQ